MLEKLTKAITKEHILKEDAAEYIAKYILNDYTVVDDSDIDYFLDNLRVFNSMKDALLYEADDRESESIALSLTDIIIEEKHTGKDIATIWLEYQDYHKVDIANADIWFTIYE